MGFFELLSCLVAFVRTKITNTTGTVRTGEERRTNTHELNSGSNIVQTMDSYKTIDAVMFKDWQECDEIAGENSWFSINAGKFVSNALAISLNLSLKDHFLHDSWYALVEVHNLRGYNHLSFLCT